MGRPQTEHLQRSGNTPIDPDHIATEVENQPTAPRHEPGGGPVPPENQPGHHPPHEQDKPDLDKFAERLGMKTDDDRDDDQAGDDVGEVVAEHAAGDEESGGDEGHTNPLGAAVSAAAGVAERARELVEPVGRAVSERIGQVTHIFDDYRQLAERVERLEAKVADLERRSDATD